MKTNTPLRRRTHGFTLVELLVVIGIILILMGLILTIIPIAKKQARNATANNMTKQIAAAVNAYHAEYAKFPPLQPSGAEPPDPSKDQWVGDPGMGAPMHNNALFYTLRKIPKGPNLNDAANPRLVTYLPYHSASVSLPPANRATDSSIVESMGARRHPMWMDAFMIRGVGNME